MSQLQIKRFSSPEQSFLVNSYLIEGRDNAMLVDAQFLRSQTRALGRMVRESGKNLSAIFITHPHPDHFLGLETLAREFPGTPAFALPEVARVIGEAAPSYIQEYKPSYGDDLADNAVVPEPLDGDRLVLEGEGIIVIPLAGGESRSGASLYIPSLKTLVAGDAVYNRVHLWLAEDNPRGWLENLETLRALPDVEAVLPGHGEPAGPELFDEVRAYLEAFMQATEGKMFGKEPLREILERFPDYRLPVIARFSVAARLGVPAGR